MKAIAELVIGDDPYLRMPKGERIAARRERRSRLFGMMPSQGYNVAPSMVDPPFPEPVEPEQPVDEVTAWVDRQKENFKEPWFVIEEELNRRVTVQEIQKACAIFYGISVNGILSARRTADVVKPRQVGYFLSKVLTLKSLPEIGKRFGDRDHTSVLHGVRKIDRSRKSDPDLESELQKIASSLGRTLQPVGCA